jgi:phosphomannomutase
MAKVEKVVVVGRDGRLSGPGLAGALIRGLASTGLDVVDLGAVTTGTILAAGLFFGAGILV